MKAALVLLFALPLCAHRLDEYLQAMLVSVGQNQVAISMRLIPGVAVSSTVIAVIDTDHDGVFSQSEQQAYAGKILRDLIIKADGQSLTPQLRSIDFPSPAELRTGLGEIHIEFSSELAANSLHRAIAIENHHLPDISVYLMNCLEPQDAAIRITAQTRNQNQSTYRVEYALASLHGAPLSTHLSSDSFATLPGMFRLGLRHIAEGTDHLLFLLALLLPAPLLAGGFRWAGPASLRDGILRIVRVVTAFTIGHSLTLALGATGVVSVPERSVEALIAVSIFISAVHAMSPLFPGREPLVAGFFGLVHGLAFATTLQNLGVGVTQRVVNLLGFNLGIEAMQLVVVAAVLPSLLMASQTPAYAVIRVTGALFAGCASLGWMVERLFGVDLAVDAVVNRLAVHAPLGALLLFALSLACWLQRHPALASKAFLVPRV